MFMNHATRSIFRHIKDGNLSMVTASFLRSDGINKLASNDQGMSLLAYAINCNNIGAADLFSNDKDIINFAGTNQNPPSLYLYKIKDKNFIKSLIDKGLDINAVNDMGQTVLHRVVSFGTIHDYATMVELGANHEIRNHRFESPRNVASRMGKKDEFLDAMKEIENGIYPENNVVNNSDKIEDKYRARTEKLQNTIALLSRSSILER